MGGRIMRARMWAAAPLLAGTGIALLPLMLTLRAQEPSGETTLEPGLYASRQSFATVVKTPPLGRRQTSVTISYALHHVTLEDGALYASTRFCAVDPMPFGGVQSTMSDEFVAAMPAPRVEVSIVGSDDGHAEVEFDEWTIVIGADLDDPTSDPLPTDDDDPRVTDPDGDGKPGVSVHLSGMIRGRTYVVQRLTRAMHGTLAADGSMRGTLSGHVEQVTLGASNPLLAKFKAEFLDETVEAQNVFEWLPVPTGTTCAELVEDAETLFE